MSYQLINTSAHKTGLPDKSVHCIVTSPPYFGLRSYSGEQDVEWPEVSYSPMAGLPPLVIAPMKCGLGAEATPEAFTAHLILVMREMWRVLRDDGTMFVNLGDSYNGSGGAGGDYGPGGIKEGQPKYPGRKVNTLKTKDLIMIPARFALAAQADGWYLRSDIIWSKPNPMPESVTDRPTKAHEYIYLLTKSQKYYYDNEAIKEPAMYADDLSKGRASGEHKSAPTDKVNGIRPHTDKQRGHGRRHAGFNERWDNMSKEEQGGGMRNKRSVWTIATRPYPGAHFATYPLEIPLTCIKAGCSEGGTILDPFVGSGTTLRAALELGRHAIGVDICGEYLSGLVPARTANIQIGLPI